MRVGSVSATAGEVTAGYLRPTELPTGQKERIPVVVAEGERRGPTLWVTAGIHPDETTSIATAHAFVDWLADRPLAGTVVCVPVMNPAGLRLDQRSSYYHDQDPNRQFGRDDAAASPKRVQALINDRIYERLSETADAIVSLHTSWAASHPYVLRPRVPESADRDDATTVEIRDRIVALADAFGIPPVNAFGAAESAERSMGHTLASQAVGRDGIPTVTPELGGRFAVDQDIRDEALAGLTNVLHTLGMVSDPTPVGDRYALSLSEPHKRHVHPHTATSGLVDHLVTEGDRVESGEPVAEIRSPNGRVETTVASDRSGFVLSRMEGAAVYENDPLLELAVPDDDPLIVRETA